MPKSDSGELDEGEIAPHEHVIEFGNPPILLESAHKPLAHVALSAQAPVYEAPHLLRLERRDDGVAAPSVPFVLDAAGRISCQFAVDWGYC